MPPASKDVLVLLSALGNSDGAAIKICNLSKTNQDSLSMQHVLFLIKVLFTSGGPPEAKEIRSQVHAPDFGYIFIN